MVNYWIDLQAPEKRFHVTKPKVSRPIASIQVLETDIWLTRRVGANRVLSIAWQRDNVGKHKGGLDADVLVTGSIIHVYYLDEPIKTALQDNKKEVRKKNAPA